MLGFREEKMPGVKPFLRHLNMFLKALCLMSGCADLTARLTDWRSVLKNSLEGATSPPSYMLDPVLFIYSTTLPCNRYC